MIAAMKTAFNAPRRTPIINALRDRLAFATERDYFIAARAEKEFERLAAQGNLRLQSLSPAFPAYSFLTRFVGEGQNGVNVAYGAELVLYNRGRTMVDETIVARMMCRDNAITLWADPHAGTGAGTLAPVAKWSQLAPALKAVRLHGLTQMDRAMNTALRINAILARGPQKSL